MLDISSYIWERVNVQAVHRIMLLACQHFSVAMIIVLWGPSPGHCSSTCVQDGQHEVYHDHRPSHRTGGIRTANPI